MNILYIILILFILLILYGIFIFNRLVQSKNLVQEGWSGIDVQLKRRADLIPNLVETVKGYMAHERGVLETVTELRSKAMNVQGISERGVAEGMLSSALSKIFALAENYPDLKANTNFLDLQKNLADIENDIQMARRYYNGATRNYNIMTESFPSNIIANSFGFKNYPYFELENPADKEVPKTQF